MTDQREMKNCYLEKYVFYGLTNLNTGYDVPSIRYFSEEDFALVLQRVEELQLGIHGIEPWLDGEYFDVETSEDPKNPTWYWGCFERFKHLNLNLHYAASYFVPDEILATLDCKELKL